MPPLPKLKIAALAELARELRFESPEAARRQLDRAEAVALEVLAECGAAPDAQSAPAGARVYPLDYIRFRITGLARDEQASPGSPIMLIGAALLADLPALIERLSVAGGITVEELTDPKPPPKGRAARSTPASPSPLRAPWLSAAELSRRWSIGRKTIDRLRRRGLLARRARVTTAGSGRSARGAAARQMLVFSLTAVEAFERAGGAPVQMPRSGGAASRPDRAIRSQVKAARAARLTDAERARIIARAVRYRARFGWTLNRCAARIAPALGRSVETVRRVLRTHERDAEHATFTERGPLTDHERTLVERSRRSGSSAAAVGARLGRSAASVHRVALERRAERLRELHLDGPRGPLFDRPAAADVHLAPRVVSTGLGGPPPGTAGELVAVCDAMEPPSAAVELARAVAYCFLRHRAATAIRKLSAHGPAAAAIDAIETDLRWASRLKAELVRSQLPTALRTLRDRLDGRGPESLPPRGPGSGPVLIHACIGALIESVDRFDPFKALAGGGRLAAPATIAVNRALTRWLANRDQLVAAGIGSRAAHKSEAAPLDDWTLRVDTWQAWLEPPEPVVLVLRGQPGAPRAALDDRTTRFLSLHYGFGAGGAPPRTASELARTLKTTVTRLSAIERRALAGAAARPADKAARRPTTGQRKPRRA